ncbi:MAG: hypothetical protein N2235_18235 [Fischerella sp.]|nr:hypothetical protein [Fischerella sp.]
MSKRESILVRKVEEAIAMRKYNAIKKGYDLEELKKMEAKIYLE